MTVYWKKKAAIVLTLLAGAGLAPPFADAAAPCLNSPNVPLQSYVYDYLQKLDGLGYTDTLLTGAKPYTRIQIAQTIRQITQKNKDSSPAPYVQKILNTLETDFQQELALLDDKKPKNRLSLKELSLGEFYYKGDSLNRTNPACSYQPLHINDNGTKYQRGANELLSLRLEGSPGENFVLSLTPQLLSNKETTTLSFGSVYAKTQIDGISLQIGKDALQWGQGYRGNLLLSGNAVPLTAIKITNAAPLPCRGFFSPLGKTNFTFLYSILEHDRSDVNYPSFIGFRADFTPTKDFTFALAGTAMVGGKGHMLSLGDYGNLFRGQNADNANDDKWNSVAGVDFRLRLPGQNGLQVYGELYGEDQAHALKVIPIPSKIAGLAGIYAPRLSSSGDWDCRLEWANTGSVWYKHSLYTNGYTYKNDVMGDAMGTNASRWFLQLSRYTADGSQISLNAEYLRQNGANTSIAQKITSLWFTLRQPLSHDVCLDASVGVARIKNKNFLAGNADKNYLFSLGLQKQF